MLVTFAQKAVIPNQLGEILLVKQGPDDPFYPHHYTLPGGRIEANESLDEALVREVYEETGLTVIPQEPLAMWEWTYGPLSSARRVIAVARLCRPSGSTAVRYLDEDEGLVSYRWIKPGEAIDLRLIPSQLEPLEIIANHLKHSHVAGAGHR